MRASAYAIAALACAACAACAGHDYLGGEAADPCEAREAAQCQRWLADRALDAGTLDVYDDPALRAYVQSIADRLATGSRLAHPPHVTISDHDGTYAPFGDRIVIGRLTLQKLGTEAEVAGVVAHEIVHVEGHHATVSLLGPGGDRWFETRRDAEGVADERAVALLERAGYTPTAMPRALAAELDQDDDEHPPRGERIARVAALAHERREGFEGRAELLAHEDHMIVGRDTRLGLRVGGAWVIASLGLALPLAPGDVVHVDGDQLELHHGRASLTAYAVGQPWAEQLAADLESRRHVESPLGAITLGFARDGTRPAADGRDTLPRSPSGTWVVVISRCAAGLGCGGLVIELAVHGDAQTRDRWLSGLRDATQAELVAAEPARIELVPAPVRASVEELVAGCPDPGAARALDNPERVVEQGELIKCTDRPTSRRRGER